MYSRVGRKMITDVPKHRIVSVFNAKSFLKNALSSYTRDATTDMRRLTTGIRSQKCVVKLFVFVGTS